MKTDSCVGVPMSHPDFESQYNFLQSGLYDMPRDFFTTEFYLSRKKPLDNWFNTLKTANLNKLISDNYNKHYGQNCRPIENWDKFSLDKLLIAPSILERSQFLKILERLIEDFSNNRSGLPDLIVYSDNELFFAEVKSKNDTPSEGQILWHDYLLTETRINVDLFSVNKTERQIQNMKNKYDSVLSESEKKELNLDKEIEKIINSEYIYQDKAKKIIAENKRDKKELVKVVRLMNVGIKRKEEFYKKFEGMDFIDVPGATTFNTLFNPLANSKRPIKTKIIETENGMKKRKLYYANEEVKKFTKTISFSVESPTKQTNHNKTSKSILSSEKETQISNLFQKAHKCENDGNDDEAINYYEKAIALKDNVPITYINLAKLYRKKKQFDNEIRICDLAFENIDTELAHKFNMDYFTSEKNIALYLKGLNDDSIINEFLDCMDEHEVKMNIYGKFNDLDMNDSIKIDELISLLNKIINSNFTSPIPLAYFNRVLGEISLFREEKETALNYFERALELDERVGIKRKYNKLKKEIET